MGAGVHHELERFVAAREAHCATFGCQTAGMDGGRSLRRSAEEGTLDLVCKHCGRVWWKMSAAPVRPSSVEVPAEPDDVEAVLAELFPDGCHHIDEPGICSACDLIARRIAARQY
jgi:hypothetical protein